MCSAGYNYCFCQKILVALERVKFGLYNGRFSDSEVRQWKYSKYSVQWHWFFRWAFNMFCCWLCKELLLLIPVVLLLLQSMTACTVGNTPTMDKYLISHFKKPKQKHFKNDYGVIFEGIFTKQSIKSLWNSSQHNTTFKMVLWCIFLF